MHSAWGTINRHIVTSRIPFFFVKITMGTISHNLTRMINNIQYNYKKIIILVLKQYEFKVDIRVPIDA